MATEQVYTRFSFDRTAARTFPPFNDCRRVYSDEHDLDIISLSDNGRRLTFQVLDVPQRRWYEFNIPRDPSRPWPPSSLCLSDAEEAALRQKFAECIQQTGCYNTVIFDADGNVVTYEFKESVGIPLRKQPIVLSSTFFPLAQYVDVTEKRYLYRAVDTCLWNGVRCIYKQLQFDSMMDTLHREIETRETLLHYFGFDETGTEPSPSLLSDRGINPILAIVVDGGDRALFYGILFAHAGTSLDKFTGTLTPQHFLSLITTVQYLQESGLEHGDICDRNVCVDVDVDVDGGSGSVQLIDFGETAPDYSNDIIATGRLMRWCLESGRVVPGSQEAQMCEEAAVALVEKQDLKAALRILGKGASVSERSAYP
jgi:hypothetical protein